MGLTVVVLKGAKMPRRGERKTPDKLPNIDDPDSLAAWSERYLKWLLSHGYSPTTVTGRRGRLAAFVRWADTRSLVHPAEVTRPALEAYQRHLFYHRKANGHPLSFRTQRANLSPVRAFFSWLTKQNVILANPAADMTLPKVERRLPRGFLTVAEAEQVLAVPDIHSALGLRDRAILELLYSTGARRGEVCRLKQVEIDFERHTVFITQGKGRKDRMVPIGERALAWLMRYLDEARPQFARPDDDGTLFITVEGLSITPDRLTQLVRGYIKKSGIKKQGSCHLFRHTCATLMLEGGADIRFIQAMLGHAKLETTGIYTMVSIRKLMAIHQATHPGARLERLPDRAEDDPET